MSDVVIESAAPLMAENLAHLHAACFGTEAWSADQMNGSLALDSSRGWVVLCAGKPVAFLLAQISGEEAEILTFGVHPDFRRKGLGGRLLGLLQACIPEGGAVFLEMAADNMPARHLYLKCGFVQTSSRKGYYARAGQAVDAICYLYKKQG